VALLGWHQLPGRAQPNGCIKRPYPEIAFLNGAESGHLCSVGNVMPVVGVIRHWLADDLPAQRVTSHARLCAEVHAGRTMQL
jgi:hypothetical protein